MLEENDRKKFEQLVNPSPGKQCFLGYSSDPESHACQMTPGEYFVINPVKDLTSRSMEGLAQYRNILLEFDTGELNDQYNKIRNRLELPLNLVTYSGNKSLHFLICLDSPLSFDEYRLITEALYKCIPGVDPKCKNPNRLSRTPGVLREDTRKYQELIEINTKHTTLTELMNWFNVHKRRAAILKEVLFGGKGYKPAVGTDKAASTVTRADLGLEQEELSHTAKMFVEEGQILVMGRSRHDAMVALAVELREKEYDITEIEHYLYRAQNACGLVHERDDVPGILRWLERRS